MNRPVPALLAALVLAAPSLSSAAETFDWKQVPRPPLRPFEPAQPQRLVLPNGMVVFLQEDHEIPVIQGILRVRGGSREEPAAKAGLVSLYGQAWRTGGTTRRTGDELDELLDARAARVETSGTLTWTSLSWNCLKEDLDPVFAVVLELLHEPAFREEKIVLARRQVETGIARRNDEPLSILGREADQLVYGADSPLARTPEYATVRAVTRDDLLAWHREFTHPNNVILAVHGDFDARAMEQRIRKAFGDWPRGPEARRADLEFPGPRPGVYVAVKKDVTQSGLALVDVGIRRDNPDYYAVEVMNAVWSGFSGRLFNNIRTRMGLAYFVGGGLGASFSVPGRFAVMMGTKSETTAAALDALRAEIDVLLREPPTAEEMARAKDSLLNSFVFEIDSPENILGHRMTYEFFGYPLDLLERYRPGIEKVTAADVLAVAQKYVHPERLAILVVGNPEEFDRPLASFGPVTELDVSIPAPPAAAPPARP